MKNEKILPPNLPKSTNSNEISFVKKKINIFQTMISNTILAIQNYKVKDIISASELNICIQGLENLYQDLNTLLIQLESTLKINIDEVITQLQKINNELSGIFRNFGTHDIDDLITVAFANDFIEKTLTPELADKYEIIKKYVHPISYKAMTWKENDSTPVKKK